MMMQQADHGNPNTRPHLLWGIIMLGVQVAAAFQTTAGAALGTFCTVQSFIIVVSVVCKGWRGSVLNSNDLRISNNPISPPSKALLLSAFCSLWPVLLVWESKEDDLTLLILAAHQKHIGEGRKCCYYQKPTFEIKLHFIPYPLFDTPRQGAAREFKAPC